jgi:branched-chain amino acid transport system permease protein
VPVAITRKSHTDIRWRRALAALLAGAFGGALLLGIAVPAAADTGARTEDFPQAIAGNVRAEGEPLEGVIVRVTGDDGFEGEDETDAKGTWRVPVPSKDGVWSVELVESSLPEGVEVPEGFSFTAEAEFGATSTVTRNFTLGAAERDTVGFWEQFLSRAVNGLNFGLMLALAAIGATLVYGTTGLANFAHGEMVTFGALVALLASAAMPIWIAIPFAVAVSALFGLGMDAGIWRPLRRKGLGLVQVMIVSIGLSLALRYVIQMIMGGRTQQLPGAVTETIPGLGPIRLTVTDVISMALSVAVILVVAWWLMRTRTGRAPRDVSDNPSLAAASGIDVDAVVRIVWVIAAALAGLSGVLWAYFRPGIKWDMGTSILLLMFAAITLGGLGTAFGALVGSIIVGLLVELSTLWIPSDLKYVGALVVLIVVLLFRPQGILGRKERIG